MSLHPTSTDVLLPACTLSCPVPLHFYQFLLFQVIFLPCFTILCCNFFVSHSFHVALFPRCTLFKVYFPCFCFFFCFAGFWRCTWFMLHSFIIHSFHLAFFLKFHSLHLVAVFPYCTFHYVVYFPYWVFSCCTFSLPHVVLFHLAFFYAALFSSFTFSVLHCFRGVCFPSCTFLCFTFFMLQFLYTPCFPCCTLFILHFFHIALYHICTLFPSCVFLCFLPYYAEIALFHVA